MPTIKITLSIAEECELRHRAQRAGMSISEHARRAIAKDLRGGEQMPDASVDTFERSSGAGKGVAAYLSPPLSRAIAQLAQDQDRSRSWIMRDLIRCELRRRGLLPSDDATAPAAVDATA
jgi:hypothetical protein